MAKHKRFSDCAAAFAGHHETLHKQGWVLGPQGVKWVWQDAAQTLGPCKHTLVAAETCFAGIQILGLATDSSSFPHIKG